MPRAKAKPSETAERVNHIAAMMRDGKWNRGSSAEVLAKDWGLSTSRVEDLSAEAWRRVCAEADDSAAMRPTIAGYLLAALARADLQGRNVDVAKVADVYSRVVGARAPEVRAEVPLTEEQARAKWKELTGKEYGE